MSGDYCEECGASPVGELGGEGGVGELGGEGGGGWGGKAVAAFRDSQGAEGGGVRCPPELSGPTKPGTR